jgi:hypothetical protein
VGILVTVVVVVTVVMLDFVSITAFCREVHNSFD